MADWILLGAAAAPGETIDKMVRSVKTAVTMGNGRRALKPDADAFLAAAKRHQVRALYHYTPGENLPAILERRALLSRAALESLGFPSPKIHFWGSGFHALADYICLCFSPPLGLLRREKGRMAALEVSPEVIAWRGTRFSPINTASSRIAPEEVESRHDLASFEALFCAELGPGLRNRSAEVLVKREIPLARIRRVVLPTRDDLRSLGSWRRGFWMRRILGQRTPELDWDREGRYFPAT